MKKFLIVLLVLALTSVASAVTVTLSSGGSSNLVLGVDVTAGQVITVDAEVDIAIRAFQYIKLDRNNTNLVLAPGSAQGNLVNGPHGSGALDGSGDITGAYGNLGQPDPDHPANTAFYSFQVTVNGEGQIDPYMDPSADAFFTSTSPYYALADGFTPLTIVPEPMTIALLGLGGLFLRRRK
jgi:hypothetical protein